MVLKLCTYINKYGDRTHCENLDCVRQLEIGQAGYLLNPLVEVLKKMVLLMNFPSPSEVKKYELFFKTIAI